MTMAAAAWRMTIWGKIIGGAAGFALGGPIGAIAGAVAGHFADRAWARRRRAHTGSDFPLGAGDQAAFTIGVIVLCAKMAKADGTVSRAEIDAFKRAVDVPTHEMADVGRLFDRARDDATGYAPYAERLAALFADRKAVLEDLLLTLVSIARADGRITPSERDYLYEVAGIFGLGAAAVERLIATPAPERDAYAVLGIGPRASDAEIRAAYLALVRRHHPDRARAEGQPDEMVQGANDRLAAINAAYDQIRRERGIP